MPTRTANDERAYQAQLARLVPRVPFDRFLKNELDWRRGEHFALIGPTGQGKTNMLHNILPLHPFVTVFATKPFDETMDKLITSGYHKMDRWQSIPAAQYPRRVLWPDARSLNAGREQAAVFADALDRIYREGGWTVALDELWYLTNKLKLREEIITYLTQARSLEISLVASTQRPASVPVEIYDQSTHLMLWRDNDEANLKRYAGIAYDSPVSIRRIVSGLERFQVLYINTRTGRMVRTRAPKV